MYRFTVSAIALLAVIASATVAASAQQTNAPDSAYVAKVMAGAPAAVVQNATIVEMQQGGPMRTLQTGTNGFTCLMLDPATPMCADKNAMLWMGALMHHTAPPNAVGFVYMLAGDNGTSNSDPYATAATPDNHWVKTGPHVMLVGPSVKTMGYPMTADPDVSKPYVMWPNTPYAHIMIPVSTGTQ
jgi:hypothetical protein